MCWATLLLWEEDERLQLKQKSDSKSGVHSDGEELNLSPSLPCRLHGLQPARLRVRVEERSVSGGLICLDPGHFSRWVLAVC